MSAEKNWQFELEEYIKQGEPGQIEKSEAFMIPSVRRKSKSIYRSVWEMANAGAYSAFVA